MNDAVRSFLDKPHLAYLSTIDTRGYPHTVPVWYAVDGDDLIFSGTRERARVKHVELNPKGAATIGGLPDDGAGYMFKGEIHLEDDSQHTLLEKLLRRYMSGDGVDQFLARAKSEQRIIFRLTPHKVLKVH